MSRTVALLAILIPVCPVAAAPREKEPSPEALAAGDQFARQLGVVAQMISREYVRPIATSDLYRAAVIGLYNAARQPEPTSLLRDLKAAKDETERINLVKRARAAVHGSPGLADHRDLAASISAMTTVLDSHSILVQNAVLNGTTTGNAYGFEFEGEAQSNPLLVGRRDAPGGVPDQVGLMGVPSAPFRVLSVKPGSPAQQGGVRPGDIVRAIDGVAADAAGADKAFLALHGAGPDKKNPGVHQLIVDRTSIADAIKLRMERTEFVP